MLVTPVLRRTQVDPKSSVASQPSRGGELQFHERPCLKAMRQQAIEDDTQCPALFSTCAHALACTIHSPLLYTLVQKECSMVSAQRQ